MDVSLLARIQFGLTAGIHFLFPPLSIGLAWLLVIIEWLAWRSKDPIWESAGRFFGKVLGLTFAVGVATGIVMEFQFGTNWSRYSTFVGDIFGAPLAAEGVFAFFLESGFLGLYIFGRGRVRRSVHWLSILLVAVGATISAFWILVANSWQQTPAGYALEGGRAVLTSFSEAVLNPSMWQRFFHTMVASLISGAFALAGISAAWLLRGLAKGVASRTLRLGLAAAAIFSLLALYPTGHSHAVQVAKTQPEKLAAMEGLYDTTSGAPLLLFAVPEGDPPKISPVVSIPGALSWLVHGDSKATIMGLNEFPADEIPPVWPTFVAFHLMVGLGTWFIALSLTGILMWLLGALDRHRWYHGALVASAPLPLIASELGWITAEVGRQPWAVYRLLRTVDAYSVTVGPGELLLSIVLIAGIGLSLVALYIFVFVREIKKGPEPVGEVVP